MTKKVERKSRYSLEFKMATIIEAEAGEKFYTQLSEELNLGPHTVRRWVKDRDKIFEEYYAQIERNKRKEEELQRLNLIKDLPPALVLSEEPPMARKVTPDDVLRRNKDLEARNSYLEDEIAYYKALLKVLKIEPTEVEKKSALQQSKK